MPRIWLAASTIVATAALWHGFVRMEAAAATPHVDPEAMRETQPPSCSSQSECPFLKAHPNIAGTLAGRSEGGAVCPFSGMSGRSSISLDDALDMHGGKASDASEPQRNRPIWL